MIDSYRHKGLRKLLLDSLVKKGIKDREVLAAMMEIPRHLFFESTFLEYAYEDKPFPIAAGQTISQPFTVARQTELLEIKKRDRVLEIGTGSGYQTSVLVKMGARVYSIERQRILYEKAKKLLDELGYYPKNIKYGDGYKGWEAWAPFNKIIVTAGAPYVPEALKEQLAINGIMVIPVGESSQRMLRITRLSETEYQTEDFGAYKFVPLLKNKTNDQ